MNTPWIVCALAGTLAPLASAQWNPENGQWLKTDPADLRVMTYNVQDAICSSSNRKLEGNFDWCGIARIVAAMKPDVLILQEMGDNTGNGTGSGVDSVNNLQTAIELFMHGGADPFTGTTVTSYVQKYDPSYDLPHIFVTTRTDNFNRNVIMSRYPFVDLNGDARAIYDDTAFVLPDAWNPSSGRGGIRGYQFVEIDLPDTMYAGDVVIGNGHLKAGGTTADRDERRVAAQIVAYYIHYWYNGAGTGTPDPNNKINDNPPALTVLDENTPVIWGGDWNEDDALINNTSGPQYWFLRAGGGTNDGTDADGSDSAYDQAVEFFTGVNTTQGSSSKLDYLAHQDSRATLRRSFVFDSQRSTQNGANPPEIASFGGSPQLISAFSSDHKPVIADYILAPAATEPGPFDLSAPAPAATLSPAVVAFSWTASSDADSYEVAVATDPALADVVAFGSTVSTAVDFDLSTLDPCATYHWGVTAINPSGSVASTPGSRSFLLAAAADLTTTGSSNGIPDGAVDVSDYSFYLTLWANGDPAADVTTTGTSNGTPDGAVDISDFSFYLTLWAAGCP